MTSGRWTDKRVLITGIGGFVGSAMAKHIAADGGKVVGIVRTMGGSTRELLHFSELYLGDITDGRLVREIISSNEIDVVFHFAGYSIVRISSRDPVGTYTANVMGTVSVLEAARDVGRCSRIIVASSDKAYGDHEVLPYTESHGLQPRNTYDTSKACMDLISRSYAHNYGLPVSVVRCSNVYGPGDRNYSRIIPNTIIKALRGERPVLYSDIEKMEREFIYIDDVVSGYDAVAGLAPSAGDVFNVGGTGPMMMTDIVRVICEEVGRTDLIPLIVPREPQFKEIQKQYIDCSKLDGLTGWRSKVGLQKGIGKSVAWYRKELVREVVQESKAGL